MRSVDHGASLACKFQVGGLLKVISKVLLKNLGQFLGACNFSKNGDNFQDYHFILVTIRYQ
jgi:hypothetical protein